jgi:S1-C subfamily serine protease
MSDRPPFSSPGPEAEVDWAADLTAVQEPLFTRSEPVPAAPTPPSSGAPGRLAPWWRLLVVAVVAALVGGALGAAVATRRRDAASASSRPENGVDVATVLDDVAPSVVAVRTDAAGLGRFFQPFPARGAGSGFVLEPDGVIVTNGHLVTGAGSVTVTLATGRSYPATVLGHDTATDLAVLKIHATHLSPVKLGSSGDLHVGDPVVAVGDALALPGGPTVSSGVVSALDRSITAARGSGGPPEHLEHLVQTDAVIDAGTSGGPLVDASGDVVGVDVALPGDAPTPGFALAVSDVQPLLDELARGVTPRHPVVGVQTVDVTPELAQQLGLSAQSGALVAAVDAGSPAARAGVQLGDVVVRFDKTEIATGEDLARAVDRHDGGDEVQLGLVRGTHHLTLPLTLGRPTS